MVKNTVIAMISALALLTGCGSDSGERMPMAPNPADTGDVRTAKSFEVELTNVDDEAQVFVNGDLVIVRRYRSNLPDRISLDPFLVPGANRVEVVLGNGGCFATSLSLGIFENGEAALPKRVFNLPTSHCGYQLHWKYDVNTNGGVVQIQ